MKDFLAISDFTSTELLEMLDSAMHMKHELKAGKTHTGLLAGKNLAMVFQKPSLRTRVSFEVGMQQLGGHAIYIGPDEIGLGTREPVVDVARVLSGYADAIMARVFEHKDVLELASKATIPVINGLSDFNHPCQAMADALTMLEEFKSLQDRQIVFVGDGNNVAQSLMDISVRLGARFTLLCPPGFELSPEKVKIAQKVARNTSDIVVTNEIKDISLQNVDVLYTDTWTSMGQETEAQKRRDIFADYQIDSVFLNTVPKTAIVMHCLPAHRGEEITNEVFESKQSRIFQQAENRLHAQKAILLQCLKN